MTARALVAAGLLALAALPAGAQNPIAQAPAATPTATAAPAEASARSIEISVSLSFGMPLKSEDAAAITAAAEAGRRTAYAIAAKECEVLMATIAKGCELQRMNVSSSAQGRGSANDTLQISTNASYKIVPRSE